MNNNIGKNYFLMALFLSILAFCIMITFLNLDKILEIILNNDYFVSRKIAKSSNVKNETNYEAYISPVPGDTSKVKIVVNSESQKNMPLLTDTIYWKTVFYEDHQIDAQGNITMTKQGEIISTYSYDGKKDSEIGRLLARSVDSKTISIKVTVNTRVLLPVYTQDAQTSKVISVSVIEADQSILKKLVYGNVIVVRGVLNRYDDKTYEITADDIVIAKSGQNE